MALRPEPLGPVPEETVRVARAAFPRGNPWLRLRDELGTIDTDEPFAPVFPTHGRPTGGGALAVSAGERAAGRRGSLGSAGRRPTPFVRARLDGKELLGLCLDDPGVDCSVLREFRARLLAGRAEPPVLDARLARCAPHGWLKAGGPPRTDSPHVLAKVRALHRIETVADTRRATLKGLAAVAPDWLRAQVDAAWCERSSARLEASRLPTGQAVREPSAAQLGADGLRRLEAVSTATTHPWLRAIPAVALPPATGLSGCSSA